MRAIYSFYRWDTWEWVNETEDSSKYLNNMRWGMRSAVCADRGQVRFQIKARRAFKWRTIVSRDVTEGHWLRWRHSTHGNNTDYKSNVKNVSGTDRYHTCGGGHDGPGNKPPT